MDDVRQLLTVDQRKQLADQAIPHAAAAVLQAELAHAQSAAVLEARRRALAEARRIYGDPAPDTPEAVMDRVAGNGESVLPGGRELIRAVPEDGPNRDISADNLDGFECFAEFLKGSTRTPTA